MSRDLRRQAKYAGRMKMILLASLLAGALSAHAQSALQIPFEVVDNRVLLDVAMDGSGPYKMILDSNSSSLTVSPKIARKLHLPLLNPTSCGGVGARTRTCYDTHIAEATVSGFKTRSDDAAVVPVDTIIQVLGSRKIDGVLGVHFFEEHVLEFDYRRQILLVYPKNAELRARGEIVDLEPDLSYPGFLAVKASIDGKPGLFAIDTGDRSNLTVFKLFSDSSDIRRRYPKFISGVTGQGINGPIHADVVRLHQFTLASTTFENFPARFPDPKDFSSTKIAGSIGNGLLAAFNFVFDYPHRRLILLSHSGRSYQTYDRSGLWLTYSPNGFVIDGIVTNSPAAKYGLNTGDLITRVNGRSHERIVLSSVRAMLSDPKLKSVKIEFKRGHQIQSCELRLSDLI